MSETYKKPTLLISFLPILFLIGALSLNVMFFDDPLEGSNQIALLLASAFASVLAVRLNIPWHKVRENMVKTISSAMPAILILLLIGSLSGTWLLSGVVPSLIYYGLAIIHPSIFLFTAVVVSSVISLATGSSWSTVATIGVALLGIGKTMGINEAAVAGAIISGAYFGDKMSPLSDTTNLAPAMAGTDLFTHVRYMMYTTVPTLAITLIIFFIMGFTTETSATPADIETVRNIIKASFNVNPVLFLVPIILIIIIVRKTPPLPSLLAGVLLGGLFAVIFQPQVITSIGGSGSYAEASYISVMKAMFGKIQVETGNATVNELFSTGGMNGMMQTIWLILSAMVFGGAMEAGGFLFRIAQSLIKLINSTTSLVASTVGACIFFNITASDQYIAIVVPGRMFAKTYKDKGYKPELLSRTLEDAGTVTSVLIPWNTCGATQARVLGVSTLTYLPYCFFNIISPIMTIAVAALNYKIRRIEEKDKEAFEEIKSE